MKGLIVAENKTVSGINREFVLTTDQSCLHRWLTEVQWMSRHWRTGTETFHRDGKQQLGLGDCQVRSGEGQTRHVYLVSAAYSLLMRSLRQIRAQDWTRQTLTAIGAACQGVKAETLEQIVDWIVDKLSVEHWSIPEIKAILAHYRGRQAKALCKTSVRSDG